MARAIVTAEERAALPEALQVEYPTAITADGPLKGRFLLKVDEVDGYALEDVKGLKSTVGAVRTEKEKLDAKLREVSTAAEAATARIKELEAIDPESEADRLAAQRVESTVNQMKTRHSEDLVAKDAEIDKLRGGLQHALIRSEAVTAITQQKGSVPLLLNALMAECQLKTRETTDGVEYYAVVLDDAKNPRIGDAQGNTMTIAQRVTEMKSKEDYARAFDGTPAAGAGRPTQTGVVTPVRTTGEKTKSEKVRDGLAKQRGEAA